jgi:hypothetical protein
VRRLGTFGFFDFADFLRSRPACRRIWFCKEFTKWAYVREALKYFDVVCVEVGYDAKLPPADILANTRIYLKVPTAFKLKSGDQVCVGAAYQDEAFEIGTGIKVMPEQYRNDCRLV